MRTAAILCVLALAGCATPHRTAVGEPGEKLGPDLEPCQAVQCAGFAAWSEHRSRRERAAYLAGFNAASMLDARYRGQFLYYADRLVKDVTLRGQIDFMADEYAITPIEADPKTGKLTLHRGDQGDESPQ